MNSKGDEHSSVPNLSGMQPMMPNMMGPMHIMPSMMGMMMPEIKNTINGTQANINTMGSDAPLIGPILPEQQIEQTNANVNVNLDGEVDNFKDSSGAKRWRDKKSNFKYNRFDRDRQHQRSRSHDKDRTDRNDRNNRNFRNSSNRKDRRTKWDDNNEKSALLPTPGTQFNDVGNMMMPGMMQYGNMMPNMMGQQPMDLANMANMSTMMPNMMGNMTDRNMMLMNQQVLASQQMMLDATLIPNQPIYVGNAVLLPPLPNTSTPNRRERPHGCRTIFVGALPVNVNQDILNFIFQRFGFVTDIKILIKGFYNIRFEKQESVELSFCLTGYRFKYINQSDNEANTVFIDYALNHEDQMEYERVKRERTPPRIEPLTPTNLSAVTEKIKNEDNFAEAAPILATWLERGECNKKNANTFYSLIQAVNNQVRRLFNEKMQLDDEFMNMKSSLKEKYMNILLQFEQVLKIFMAAKHQRVSDHFNKQQRRNIEIWLKMSEDVNSFKEEFNIIFEDEAYDKIGKKMVPEEKYEELKAKNENLTFELEGYKNEAFLAKEEVERKFEMFKAHFIAQQALQGINSQHVYPPLPPPPQIPSFAGPPLPSMASKPSILAKPEPPPPTTHDSNVITSGPSGPPSEAKLISILTAFLMVHPLGASLDYLVSYVRSMVPSVTQATVDDILIKYSDVFSRKTTGVGASIEHRWGFVTFESIKVDAKS